ncbi:hypothetical protein ARMGADRAFT_1063596 [Armillaria gallica]|uniref:Uncharacterized protein n=1 Tax=Armillaria gallica TaxID=47427 RepID=A0A2H3DFZ6_ARMGA|nr:hypothetical protein ARMGADRAFT_1063596 [Armillaria gallica]
MSPPESCASISTFLSSLPFELKFVTPVFPFYARYIWLTINAKKTLADLDDPEVDIVTQDMKGKIYVGSTQYVDPEFTSAAMEFLAPGQPERFPGIEPWMSLPLSPQVEDPRADREPIFPTNAFPLPGFCHWTILPTVTCKFPKKRGEPGDAPRLGPVGQSLYSTFTSPPNLTARAVKSVSNQTCHHQERWLHSHDSALEAPTYCLSLPMISLTLEISL